jgi:copper chaperone CopZ
MTVLSETMQVTGIRCERCVARLAATLKDEPGLEQANASLMGQVTLSWDDDQTSRDTLVAAMARGGFRLVEAV